MNTIVVYYTAILFRTVTTGNDRASMSTSKFRPFKYKIVFLRVVAIYV